MAEDQMRFNLDVELRTRMDAVFEAQGVNMKEGLHRLIRFLVESPDDMHPIILNQVRGDAARVVARSILGVSHVPKDVRKQQRDEPARR